MGYVIGLFKYTFKSAFKNTYPMLVFGAATLALIYLIIEIAQGQPAAGVTAYVITKYLPPLTMEGFATVLVVGCAWAGIKWYWGVTR